MEASGKVKQPKATRAETFYSQLKDMNHFFKCYEAVVPRIKRPTAICEITGIT